MQRPITAVFVLGLLVGSAWADAKAWDLDSFPDPKRDVNLCGRKGKKSNICDPDGVLSYSGANRVEGLIKDIWNGVHPYALAPCGDKGDEGFQVAVAVMTSMAVKPGEDAAAAAHHMAKGLHAKWGVGDAACDNGVLLLLAINQRQVYISTGAAAQAALDNARLNGIIGGMRMPLRAGHYDSAVEQAVVDIGLGLARGGSSHESWEWFPVMFFGGLLSWLAYTCWSAIKRCWQYRSCRSALERIKDEQEKLRSKEWSRPRTCPVCLDDFAPTEAAPSAPATPEPVDEPTAPLLPSESGKLPEEVSEAAPGPSKFGLRRRNSAKELDPGEGRHKPAGQGPGRRTPVTLPCGHTFCEPCIEKWLRTANTCPICRERVDTDASTSGSRPTAQSSSTAAAQAQRAQRAFGNEMLTEELIFRLMSLRNRYPDYISPSLIDTWGQEARTTGSFNWESARDFQLRDPGIRDHHESQGASGSSFSFGGGSGAGGGGAGGSW